MTIAELKQQKIWLCWRYETKNDRQTKVPYGADGKKCGATEAFRKRWVTYDDAVKARDYFKYDGVGLVIQRGFGGLDEDDRAAADFTAVTIRERFKTYEELSPSGTGQHLLFTCDLSLIPQKDEKISPLYYAKNPHNELELYFGGLTSRFFTFTDNVITDLEIADCTEAALWFLNEYMLKAKFKKRKASKSGGFDPLAAARNAKNGEKFIALYDNGDISGYGSDSEADLALCIFLLITPPGTQ
jgi:primase-polymerase (primpol)-like protein